MPLLNSQHLLCLAPPAAALLERQMVVFCPNIGVLSAAVLALVPLMRPFAWQSLLLPVLPVQEKMLDLLEAPVPFIFGIKVRKGVPSHITLFCLSYLPSTLSYPPCSLAAVWGSPTEMPDLPGTPPCPSGLAVRRSSCYGPRRSCCTCS